MKHIGSTTSIILGLLLLFGSLADPSGLQLELLTTGFVIILGALAFRSAKKRKLLEVNNSIFRFAFELIAIFLSLALIFSQGDPISLVQSNPLANFIIPVWIVCAYAFTLLTSTGIGFSKTTQNSEFLSTHSTGGFDQEVVGESFYQKELNNICGGYTKKGHKLKVDTMLVYEDSNPHDSNAIKVVVSGKTVGYLSRNDAKTYRSCMDNIGKKGEIMNCKGLITGGWKISFLNNANYGIRLDIDINDIKLSNSVNS